MQKSYKWTKDLKGFRVTVECHPSRQGWRWYIYVCGEVVPDLPWHKGCTFEWDFEKDGVKYQKRGCDFQHALDDYYQDGPEQISPLVAIHLERIIAELEDKEEE